MEKITNTDREILLKQLKKDGFSEEIINAFKAVKRENFIPEEYKSVAYKDVALPLAKSSTISQPSTIAFMLQLAELKQGQKILEIGSCSGYLLALISEIVKTGKIYGMEISEILTKKSSELLKKYL